MPEISASEAYEWALFGAMLWSQDAREGVLPTDFSSGKIQPLVAELLDVMNNKLAKDAGSKTRIRNWLENSRIDIHGYPSMGTALKKVVQRLSALGNARILADRLSTGLSRSVGGLTSTGEAELRQLVEKLAEKIKDATE